MNNYTLTLAVKSIAPEAITQQLRSIAAAIDLDNLSPAAGWGGGPTSGNYVWDKPNRTEFRGGWMEAGA